MINMHALSRTFQILFQASALLLIAATVCTSTSSAQTPAAIAQPAQFGFLGMNTYFTGLERISHDGDDGIATLEALGRAGGVRWGREELSWGNIERKSKGSFDWKYFDKRLGEMAQAGYGIVGMLLTTPQWARAGDCAARLARYAGVGVNPQNYWCPPANVQDYADYVRATVERYDGDGYQDAPGSPRVAVWQLWNEPNAWETWPGSPQEYGALVAAGYAAVKAADPTALVALGGVYVFDGSWNDGKGHSDGLRFLDAALTVPGAWNAFDALAIHPYMPDVAPDQPGIVERVTMWGRITTARDWLAARTATYGGPLRPLWISEVGWSTCGKSEADCYIGTASAMTEGRKQKAEGSTPTDVSELMSAASEQSYDAERWPMSSRPSASSTDVDAPSIQAFIGKTEEQQADYMVRTAAMARALGVEHMSYFQFEDKFDGSANNFWQAASIVGTKATGYQPKIAYTAYRVLTEQLGDAAFIGYGSAHTYSYNAAAQRNPTARYHLRFRATDNALVDVLWLTDGKQSTVSVPVEAGRSALLVTRDGGQASLPITQGHVTVAVNDHPIYLRQPLPPTLAVYPANITALSPIGTTPQSLTLVVANSGSGTVIWNATGNAAWLRLSATSGQAGSNTLPITLDPTGLAPDIYNAMIVVTSNGGTQQIEVQMRVVGNVWKQVFPVMMR